MRKCTFEENLCSREMFLQEIILRIAYIPVIDTMLYFKVEIGIHNRCELMDLDYKL